MLCWDFMRNVIGFEFIIRHSSTNDLRIACMEFGYKVSVERILQLHTPSIR